jgi:hypothetical protein
MKLPQLAARGHGAMAHGVLAIDADGIFFFWIGE